MANRFPLVVDTSDNNKIKELPSGDNLNLAGSGIVNASSIQTSGTVTAQSLIVNGETLSAVALSGQYADLEGAPTGFSGSYNDLINKPTIPTTTRTLTDVQDVEPNEGDILQWNSIAGRYEPTDVDLTPDLSAITLGDIGNVIITGDTTNKWLKYYSGAWRPASILYSDIQGTPSVSSFDQDLNTTDAVRFNSVAIGPDWDAGSIGLSGLVGSRAMSVGLVISSAYDDVADESGSIVLSVPNAGTTQGIIELNANVEFNSAGIISNDGEDNLQLSSANRINLQAGGVVNIAADVSEWQFDTDGTLYLPVGGDIKDSEGSSVLGGGGGAIASRTSSTESTGTIADAATADLTFTGFKSYMLLKIETSDAAWVRIYTDAASRTADSSRLQGDDPAPGAGVVAEVITTGAETILISPGALGFNNETVPTTDIEVAVTNNTGGSADISVVLHLLQLEA